ncbi:unnamed protein product [Ilex paraguariensis]|uniref:Uncharacterized protein n=1 Tax=Ilex paraguariensis TaxID=185542 RepID=A0ABC8T9J4_9AQUA
MCLVCSRKWVVVVVEEFLLRSGSGRVFVFWTSQGNVFVPAKSHVQLPITLLQLRVDDILIRGLKWSKLLNPDKKAQWWLCGDMASSTENIEEVASTIDR